MSSDRPNGAPSREPENQPDPGLPAEEVRTRGAELLGALEDYAPGSRPHAEATAFHAVTIAWWLRVGDEEAELVRQGALLHDVGKLYVPAALLARPPAELAPEEAAQLEGQFQAAARLVRGAGLPDAVAEMLAALGERFDGAGPQGLGGEAIPRGARIIRVACAYDAMASGDAYGDSPEARAAAALAALRGAAGAELDPQAVEALAGALGRRGGDA